MTDFPKVSVLEALEQSLAAADHLGPKHSAVVGAARALAAKIDAWDTIVQWALEDVGDSGQRPRVPANDNTSLGTYSRYLEQLGLTVPPAKQAGKESPQPATKEPATGPGATITSLQDRVAGLKAR